VAAEHVSNRDRLQAFDHKVQEPRETDTHSPTEVVQRHVIMQQVLHQRALLIRDDALIGTDKQLASACLALMILLAAVSPAVFLELRRSTP
jgi:hypothetical protein